MAEYIGIASAALSGFCFAVRRKFDLLGIFISAFLTALGGGLIRDILVSRAPYSFTHYTPVLIVLCVMILSIFLKVHKQTDIEKKFIFVFTDAIDLISFSIVGSIVALQYNMNIFGVIIIGFFNGAGGGFLRDITFNEIPWFLRTGLYGTISMAISLIYFIFEIYGLNNIYSFLGLMVFGVVVRLLAYYRNWHLPILE